MAPRTLLGPLTTPFTYPASCLNNVLSCTTASDCTVGWQEQTCGVNPANSQGIGGNTNCWPPVTNGVTQAQPYAVLGWGFYSPAYSCPVGYSTACSAYGGQDGGFDFQFELLAGETAVGCCPTGYTCGSLYTFSNFQTCISVVTTGIITTVQCSEEQSVSPGFFHVPATVTSAGTAETISSVTLYAPLFQDNPHRNVFMTFSISVFGPELLLL